MELQVRDYDKLEDITYEIAVDTDSQRDKFGGVYYVRNIEQLNPQIFEWLNLLDLNVWVILFLMIGVAGFTMISGLLIIIIERTNMIGILKALGADNFTIRKTFLWFAVFLSARGCFGAMRLDWHSVLSSPNSEYLSSIRRIIMLIRYRFLSMSGSSF